jgi:hypothetical protein
LNIEQIPHKSIVFHIFTPLLVYLIGSDAEARSPLNRGLVGFSELSERSKTHGATLCVSRVELIRFCRLAAINFDHLASFPVFLQNNFSANCEQVGRSVLGEFEYQNQGLHNETERSSHNATKKCSVRNYDATTANPTASIAESCLRSRERLD